MKPIQSGSSSDDDEDEKMKEKEEKKLPLFPVFSQFAKKGNIPFPVLEDLTIDIEDDDPQPPRLQIRPSFYELFLDRTPTLRSLEMEGNNLRFSASERKAHFLRA